MLCQNAFLFKFVFSVGNKETIKKVSLTLEATNSILVLVEKWRHHANSIGRVHYILKFRHGYEALWSNFTTQFCFLYVTDKSSGRYLSKIIFQFNLKPLSHVLILIHRTWPIDIMQEALQV